MAETSKPATYSPDLLRLFSSDVLKACNLPAADTQVVAQSLIDADLRGVDTHGISRLAVYVKRLKAGVINAHPRVSTISERASAALVDGDNAFGQVSGRYAMAKAIEMAGKSGAGFVGVRGGSHFGACAFYTLQAVDAGMVGLAMTNTGPSMAPWGAAQAFFGTNPLSFAFPAGQYRPVVLDMATSLVARGKIILAAKKGEPIPLGWALDEKGRPTTDAQAALRGTVLPAGGPKGSGLAFVVEVLTSVLTGALIGAHVPPMYEDFQNPTNCGFFFGAIDVSAFIPLQRFKERIDAMIEEIKALPPAEGQKEVFVPGEIEWNIKRARERDGIPLSPAVVAELRGLGSEVGVEFPVG